MGSQILYAFFKEAVSRVGEENYSETNKPIDLLRCICQKNILPSLLINNKNKENSRK